MHRGMILIPLPFKTEGFLLHQRWIDAGIYLFYLLNYILKVILFHLLTFQISKTLKSEDLCAPRTLVLLWALKFASQYERKNVRKNAKTQNPF